MRRVTRDIEKRMSEVSFGVKRGRESFDTAATRSWITYTFNQSSILIFGRTTPIGFFRSVVGACWHSCVVLLDPLVGE